MRPNSQPTPTALGPILCPMLGEMSRVRQFQSDAIGVIDREHTSTQLMSPPNSRSARGAPAARKS